MDGDTGRTTRIEGVIMDRRKKLTWLKNEYVELFNDTLRAMGKEFDKPTPDREVINGLKAELLVMNRLTREIHRLMSNHPNMLLIESEAGIDADEQFKKYYPNGIGGYSSDDPKDNDAH